MANVLQIPVPSRNAALVWPARSDPSVNTILLINQDLNNVIYIGQQQSITAGGQNTIPVPPNGSISVDPASPWYVIGAVAGISPLVMVPNGQANFLGLTQGLGKLAIPAIQSPNFIHSVSGWNIAKDGSAEFNNLVIRGSFMGNDFILNSSGLFIYSGTPALGNLIMSVVSVSGTDPEGNTTQQILTIYGANGAFMNFNVASGTPQQNFVTGAVSEQEPATTFSQINSQGAANESMSLFFVGPASTWDNTRAVIIHNSAAADGSVNPSAELVLMQGNVVTATIASWDAAGLHTNLPVIYQQFGGTPPAVSGAAVTFSVNGNMQYVDGYDLTTYAMSRRSLVLGADTGQISSTNFSANIFSSPIAAPPGSSRKYRIRGVLMCVPAVSAGKIGAQWAAGAGIIGNVNFVYTTGSVSSNSGGLNNGGSSGGASPTMTAGQEMDITFQGTIEVPAGGSDTLKINVATSLAADTFLVRHYSAVDIEPV